MASSKLSLVRNTGDDGSDRPLTISHSTGGGLHKVKSKTMPWSALVAKLTTDVRTDMTQKKYDGLTTDARQREKMRAGFLFGGVCADGHRANANVQSRALINLDIDTMSKGDFLAFQFECGDPNATDLNRYEYVWYTTRSHTPEKPKFRIILPFEESCTPDKFHAISRIIAAKFDPTMELLDRVSFVLGQMMYWPLTNKDGEFVAGRNKGKFIDVESELQAFGDWQDFSKLPSKEDEDLSSHNNNGQKIASPFEKTGIVGAFCRAYSIEEAIEQFIPDVYEKSISTGKTDRYTYLKSETGQTGGVLVYPDQGLMFSHHNSDPCGDGHGHNAFDMVRLHLYGDLDEGSKIDNPTRQKSFKALEEQLEDNVDVKKQLLQENYDFDAMIDAVMGSTSAAEPKIKPAKAETVDEDDEEDELGNKKSTVAETDWIQSLDLDSNGVIKTTLSNVYKILSNDPRVKGVIGLNDFRNMPVKLKMFPNGSLGYGADGKQVRDVPVIDDVNGELWSDNDDVFTKLFFSLPKGKGNAHYGIEASEMVIMDALKLASLENRFHPVKRMFEAVKWDGKPRIETMFIDYFGCPDNEYYRMTAKLSLIAAVDRIYMPGAKWDFVPILEGPQGAQKSTFIRLLANNWFAELRGHDLGDNRKMAELFEGALLVEIPELHTFSRAESNALKSFFSAVNDKARAAFAKRVADNKRVVCFWGSTNERTYLKDKTGNRRYWPIIVLVGEIDIPRMVRNRPQLWAEAKHYRDEMRAEQPLGDLPLYLPRGSEAAKIALELQDEKRIDTGADQDVGTLEHWLDELAVESVANCGEGVTLDGVFEPSDEGKMIRRDITCIQEIVRNCPAFEGGNNPNRRSQEVSAALSALKTWKPAGRRRLAAYGRQRVYIRKGGIFDPDVDDI